jgi:hypothetical protein
MIVDVSVAAKKYEFIPLKHTHFGFFFWFCWVYLFVFCVYPTSNLVPVSLYGGISRLRGAGPFRMRPLQS